MTRLRRWIKYDSPWRWVEYNKNLYNGENYIIDYHWKRNKHFGFGILKNGNKTSLFGNNHEIYFCDEYEIHFIFASISIKKKREFYYRNGVV